jgi:hypothetical protein
MGGAPFLISCYSNGVKVFCGSPEWIPVPEFSQTIVAYFLSLSESIEDAQNKATDMMWDKSYGGTPVEEAMKAVNDSMQSAVDTIDFDFSNSTVAYDPTAA